jgi:para-nitrobenzyl esterase
MKEAPNQNLATSDVSLTSFERRELLKGGLVLLGAASAAPLTGAQASTGSTSSPSAGSSRATTIAHDGAPVVSTASGKVVGFVHDGVNVFKGIPYADTTAGANRFMPPVKPVAWSTVRSCRQFGNVSPQGPRAGWANDEEAFMFTWDDGIQGENCLRVNLWSPGVNDGKRRPVMVWLHGGGFSAGSGQELLSYDGESLARRGDVVVVTLNHRLNVFGFLDLSQYGDQYAGSANVGMLDIVAALEWVRDNISGFGGDPDSVTIFGQSGGGGKVSVLMGMPSAKGLFHKAIVESGSMLRARTPDKSQELAGYVVSELGLAKASIGQIHTLPFDRVLQASLAVMKAHSPTPAGGVPDIRRMGDLLGFAPVMDGKVLPEHPFDPKASPLSQDVPMIVGTTLNEFVTAVNHPEALAMTESDLQDKVKALFGSSGADIIAAFKQRTPQAPAFWLWSRIAASRVRQAAIQQATVKAAAGKAPAYLYWFTWQTPILNGRPGAFHCSEIAFAFNNTDRCEAMTGGGPEARKLGGIVSDAWIHFARTGDPNHPGMPHWDAFTPAAVPTMIFDSHCQAVDGPDRGEQASIANA